MELVVFYWPYAGLLLAAVLLAALILEKPLGGIPRWRNPAFVLGLLWPMYLLHQFEEHGVDALGRHYAFLAELCSTLGYGAASGCPADPAFIFAVNVAGCQIAFVVAWWCRRTRPLVSACAWGIPIVNAVTHFVAAVLHRGYNPGVVTSGVLFVPLSALMLSTLLHTRTITIRNVSRVVGSGVVVHIVLIASLLLSARGWLAHEMLLAINAANGITPLIFGTVGVRGEQRSARDVAASTTRELPHDRPSVRSGCGARGTSTAAR